MKRFHQILFRGALFIACFSGLVIVQAAPLSSPSPLPIDPSSGQDGLSQKSESPSIPEEFAKLRDPFRAPESQIVITEARSDLEMYSVEDFKMIGSITGPNRLRAILSSPDGRTFFVAEKMRIGLRGGVIKRITPEKIVISEKMTNAIGQQESIQSEIKMTPTTRIQIMGKPKESPHVLLPKGDISIPSMSGAPMPVVSEVGNLER